MRKYLLLLLLLCPALAKAQGVAYSSVALYNSQGNAKIAASALVTVCPAGSLGEPCAPANVLLYSDIAETMPLSNPTNADFNGNINFVASSGNYTLTITGVGIVGTTQQISLLSSGGGGGSITLCSATGGVVYQNGTLNTGTCDAGLVRIPGSIGVLDINNSSTGAPSGPLTVRGVGAGGFTPANGTTLVNFQQQSQASSLYALAITNRQANSGSGSAMIFSMTDGGVGQMCSGNAVGDGNGNFGCLYWDSSEQITAQTAAGTTSAGITPFNVKAVSSSQIANIFSVKNSTGTILAGVDNLGGSVGQHFGNIASEAITGTGACATITGASSLGTFTCTGVTGASTITINFTTTALHGWVCSVYDQTTRADNPSQTANSVNSCTVTSTTTVGGDVFIWSATKF